eukprot:gene21959-47193_t
MAPALLSSVALVAAAAARGEQPAGSCKVFANTDFAGHDLKRGTTANPDACCSLCQANAGCGWLQYWTFMPPATCYMKTSDAGRRPSPRPDVEYSGCGKGGTLHENWQGECTSGKCACDP